MPALVLAFPAESGRAGDAVGARASAGQRAWHHWLRRERRSASHRVRQPKAPHRGVQMISRPPSEPRKPALSPCLGLSTRTSLGQSARVARAPSPRRPDRPQTKWVAAVSVRRRGGRTSDHATRDEWSRPDSPVRTSAGDCWCLSDKRVLRVVFNPIGQGLDASVDNIGGQRITPLTRTQTPIDAEAEIGETSGGSAHTVLTIGDGQVGNDGPEVHPSTVDGLTTSKQFPGNSLRPHHQPQCRQGDG